MFYYSFLTPFFHFVYRVLRAPLPSNNLHFLLPRILGIIQRAHVPHRGCTHVLTTCYGYNNDYDDDDGNDGDNDVVVVVKIVEIRDKNFSLPESIDCTNAL